VRRKRGHSGGHVNHERWLVSYADFITLMFAFFVVLYSSSQVDQRKISKLAAAIQAAFQELGLFDFSSHRPPLDVIHPAPLEQHQPMNLEPPTGMAQRLPLTLEPDRTRLRALRQELELALAEEIRRHTVAIEQRREGIVISLREVGFYDSGSAVLRPTSEPIVHRLANLLRPLPEPIRIEGHTDNVPIHNSRFASNWELSTARATEMVRLFITRYGFRPERLSAAGYGEYHPVASNATPEGRAKNRRVDIVILTHAGDFTATPAGPAPGEPAREP
jgi:chemotaxis protein MotB